MSHQQQKLIITELNSNVLDWLLKQISTPFQGGFYSFARRFIEKLPIVEGNSGQSSVSEPLVDYLLWLNRHFFVHSEAKTARDELMLGYFEQILNGLVYELYFPDELHARKLNIFDLVRDAKLPRSDDIPESSRLTRLRKVFETLYGTNHPVRAALFSLRSLETVRIIEGET